MKNLFVLVLITLFISSCASFYKPFDPHNFDYDPLEGEDLSYAVKRNVLSRTGNNRYAKKEYKYGINIVSVKIKNNTTETITVKDDVKFMVNGGEIIPLETYIVEDKIKQKNIGLYALYGLLFLTIETPQQQGLYPIGVPIAIGNIAVASSSNSKFRKNFSEENILNKTIEPGETIYGVVAFSYLNTKVLSIELD